MNMVNHFTGYSANAFFSFISIAKCDQPDLFIILYSNTVFIASRTIPMTLINQEPKITVHPDYM